MTVTTPREHFPMRINRYLALCGLGSRRSVEDLIQFGRITVNGERAVLGMPVTETDDVRYDDKPVKPGARHDYIMLNKPPGYVCSRGDTHGRPTVYDLLPPEYQNLHYVGRLDMDSRGLLFFTSDGDLTLKLTHPSNGVPRVYAVRTKQPLSDEDIQDLLGGVEVEPGVVFACAEVATTQTGYRLTLTEGKKREIRRLLHALHHHVIDLKRVAFGEIKLGDVPEGRFRTLEYDEVEILKG
jgi:23S rRNA pseudouridine2605 synthase